MAGIFGIVKELDAHAMGPRVNRGIRCCLLSTHHSSSGDTKGLLLVTHYLLR